MKKTVIAIVSAGLVIGGLSYFNTVSEPGSQGLWQIHNPNVSVSAWSFENKSSKNKKRKVIHRGGW